MEIDGATRKNLELLESLTGDKGATLLSVMDRTVTAVGGRLLAGRVASPLVDLPEINQRLDVIEFFMNHPRLREDIRELLKSCPDMERAVSRLSLGRGGPRDLANIKTTLSVIPKIKNILSDFNSGAALRSNMNFPRRYPPLSGVWVFMKIWSKRWIRRLMKNCRCWRVTAALSAPAIIRRSMPLRN